MTPMSRIMDSTTSPTTNPILTSPVSVSGSFASIVVVADIVAVIDVVVDVVEAVEATVVVVAMKHDKHLVFTLLIITNYTIKKVNVCGKIRF